MGIRELKKIGHVGSGTCITKLESESISSNHMSGSNLDTESSYTILNC